ncbi:MAG TPA: TetR/AcrR family transcriptional regulator [Candidatus Acidoferrales bacterium]|nr:TetR/AcrR family transcriptional regulator [Candidatus Acidoferrales bacterium]
MSEPVHPPKQQRSRETLARLLEATIETVNEHGLAGTTIPRIAERAKVAPASIYRRFRDKEALLRSAFIGMLERSNAVNAAAIPAHLEGHTLEWVAGALARSLIAQYRRNPNLMRALIRFTESDDDQKFRARAMSLVARNASFMVDAIVKRFSAQIAATDPHRAVTFATLVMANVVQTRTLESSSLWSEMLPVDDDTLVAELKRLFVSYLTQGA